VPSLIGKDGALQGRRIEVTSDVTIGRENADVLVDDPEVSRNHAVVRPLAGALEIEDLSSTNGTFVNGIRVALPTRLSPGDGIRIGIRGFQQHVCDSLVQVSSSGNDYPGINRFSKECVREPY
jgi:pSer/pThr/pTyr-binding forkhead associated (FHA) protein